MQVQELPRPEPRHLKPLPQVQLVPWWHLRADRLKAVAVAGEGGPAGLEQSSGGMGRTGLIPCLLLEQLLLEPWIDACACCLGRWLPVPCTTENLLDSSTVS